MRAVDRAEVYRRRMEEAQARRREWEQKISDAGDSISAHQLGVWRAQVRRWRQTEELMRKKLEDLDKKYASTA